METLPENWQPNDVEWYQISRYEKLSEDFIRKYKDRLAWHSMSAFQTLSEELIREYQDKVNWSFISKFQKHISTKFLNQYQYKMSYFWTDMIGREYY